MRTTLLRKAFARRVSRFIAAVKTIALAALFVHDTASAQALTRGEDIRVVIGSNRHFADSSIAEVTLRDRSGRICSGLAYDSRSSTDPDLVSLWQETVLPMLGIPSDFDSCIVTEHRSPRTAQYAVGFVLDHSPSMTTPRAIRMQRAVHEAIRRMDPSDAVTVVKFTANVRVEVPLMTDKPTALESFKINGINVRQDGTAIYDAVLRGVEEVDRAATGYRRVLMVFTDGEDNASTVSLDSVIKAAKSRKTAVHVITYGVSDTREVSRLAHATGGTIRELVDVFALDSVFLSNYRDLRTTHTVRVWHAPGRMQEHGGAITTLEGVQAREQSILNLLPMLPTTGVEILQGHSDAHALVIRMQSEALQAPQAGELINDGLTGLGWMMRRETDVMVEILRRTKHDGMNDPFDFIRSVLMQAGIAPHRVVRGATVEQRLGSIAGADDSVLMILYRQ